jgi:SAM-dependent methyltransferase
MRDRRAIIELNKQQKAYYESRFEAAGDDERAANRVTNLWTRLRRRIQRYDQHVGTHSAMIADHEAWLGQLAGKRVLDLGCFSGNDLSVWIAERADEYVGMDLSEQAIAQLREKLEAAAPKARAEAFAGDFLQNGFPAQHFDVIYAHSVLHHFENLDCVLEEMERVLRPGGMVVAVDPLATEPLNRLVRALYRPFQSDRDWEWPFTGGTFRAFRRYFQIERVQGYRGLAMLGLPLAVVPFMEPVAHRLGRLGLRLDRRLASRPGPFLWLCWMVSTRMVKPGPNSDSLREGEGP